MEMHYNLEIEAPSIKGYRCRVYSFNSLQLAKNMIKELRITGSKSKMRLVHIRQGAFGSDYVKSERFYPKKSEVK